MRPGEHQSRSRRNLGLLGRFAVVGASGVLVNMAVLVLLNRLGPAPELDVLGLVGDYHVRWYHVFSTVAFLVANLSNFQLNRSWTFHSSRYAGWWREYWPFLAVGLAGQAVGLVLLTLLMNRASPMALPPDLLDDSTGLRTRLYWAQLIVIGTVTPLSFVLNKLWTFAAVRTHRLAALPLHPAAGPELEVAWDPGQGPSDESPGAGPAARRA